MVPVRALVSKVTTALPITEAVFQKTVVKRAQDLGWKVALFRAARVRAGRVITPVGADGAGWPDLAMVRGDRLLFVELKQDSGYRKPNQRAWHAALGETGNPVLTWKPRDWRSGAIEAALA